MTCPICGSEAKLERWDYYDHETGYHDVGAKVDCEECGVMYDEDIEKELALRRTAAKILETEAALSAMRLTV
jgi:uncharacterized Zn finger protein